MGHEDTDFFAAFVKSLRSSCLQHISFRDNVSIRGYFSVDVDGGRQEHYVLAERISRGKDNNTRGSFPLQVLKVSKSLECFSSVKESQNAVATPRAARRNIFPSPFSQSKKNIFKKKSTELSGKPPISKVNYGKEIERKSQYIFSKKRNDPTNLTFTLDPGVPPKFNRGPSSSFDKQPTISISRGTFDICTGKQAHCDSRTSCDSSDLETEEDQVGDDNIAQVTVGQTSQQRVQSHQDKLPGQDSVAEQANLVCRSYTLSRYFGNHGTQMKRSENNDDNKKKREVRERSAKKYSPRSSASVTISPKIKCLEEYRFFSVLGDLDSECSITAVRPNYLVNHNEDNDDMLDSSIGEGSSFASKAGISDILQQTKFNATNDKDMHMNTTNLKKQKTKCPLPKQQRMETDGDAYFESNFKSVSCKVSSRHRNREIDKVQEKTNHSRSTNPSHGTRANNGTKCQPDSERCNLQSASLTSGIDEELNTWPCIKQQIDSNIDVCGKDAQSPKKKRKFMKLMHYFKKGTMEE